ncbi:MAG TPA: 2-isopropylmalate synthase, partial [Candidatus Altiarchaeales archaeon]|nr:2-isopropylmalate synthase [Candidatus Altiarchaeales archaeon]
MEYLWYNKRALQDEELPERIVIFDTTLRDGEQTPGVALTPEQKIEIAKALDALGVDIIEAGFPIASKGDFKAVKEIASLGLNAEICGLARCVKEDIDKCIEANVDLIHIFIGTSPIHRKYKLRMSKEEILRKAEESIQYCLDHGFKVHFSPEDACRT